MDEFNKELTAGNLKAAMKSHEAGSRDLWQVDPRKIRTMDGFNVRTKDADYDAHIRWIADSIKENGFFQYEPLGVVVANEGGELVIYAHRGHCRLAAVLLAIEEGAEVERVPCVASPAGTSMEDLTVELHNGNGGKPLSTYEKALVCKRLSRFGWDSAKIAKRLGYSSVQYVDGLLSLAGAPVAVRDMVQAGQVSATVAIDVLRTQGDKAASVLQEAKGDGERKVTRKHVAPADPNKYMRKYAAPMHSMLTSITADPRVPEDLRGAIATLLSEVKP